VSTAWLGRSDGYAVEVELLDEVPPILSGIGDGIRTARGLTSTGSAAATGNAELMQVVTQFGSILAELLERSDATNELDRQRIVAVRRRYDDVERTNARRMQCTVGDTGDPLGQWTGGVRQPLTMSGLSVVPAPSVGGRSDTVRHTVRPVR
jgi:hypothetical protein